MFPYWALAFAAQPQNQHLLWLGISLFFLFGIGTTVSATAINALLVDQVPENQRGTGMTLVWIMTLMGFIIGSEFFHYIFSGNQINRLEIIFWIFTGVALVITLVSVIGIETPKPGFSSPASRLDGIGRILKGFGQSSQAILFFSFLAATVFFPAMQIFILTPYGGEILKLSVGETAKFGIYTSYGTLLGMGMAYWWQQKSTKSENNFLLIAALLIGAVAFSLLSWSAWQPQESLGKAGLWIFGFSKGLYNAGISFLTMRLGSPGLQRGIYGSVEFNFRFGSGSRRDGRWFFPGSGRKTSREFWCCVCHGFLGSRLGAAGMPGDAQFYECRGISAADCPWAGSKDSLRFAATGIPACTAVIKQMKNIMPFLIFLTWLGCLLPGCETCTRTRPSRDFFLYS